MNEQFNFIAYPLDDAIQVLTRYQKQFAIKVAKPVKRDLVSTSVIYFVVRQCIADDIYYLTVAAKYGKEVL